MANFSGVEYTALNATAGKMGDARDGGAKVRRFPFTWVVPTTPGTGPTVNLCKIPAGAKHPVVYYETDGLSASAGVALNVRIGDSGDDDRYMADVDSDLAATSGPKIVAAGQAYAFTQDTIIVATITAGKTPVATKKIWGWIDVQVE